jgi:hypothetical protein
MVHVAREKIPSPFPSAYPMFRFFILVIKPANRDRILPVIIFT